MSSRRWPGWPTSGTADDPGRISQKALNANGERGMNEAGCHRRTTAEEAMR